MVRPPTLILALPSARDDLRQRDVVGVELVQIDIDVILLGRAAPGVDLNDARHGQQAALHDPILNGAQIGQAEVRRPDHLIAINLAHQAGGLDLRRHAVRQADVLLQIDRRLRQGEVIIDAVVEGHPHKRQTVERRRTDDVDARRRGKPDFDRDGVVALHLLGRQTRRLRGDFQDHRRRIGIGFDVQPGEGKQAGADEQQKAEQNQRSPRQAECKKTFQHCRSSHVAIPSVPMHDRSSITARWRARC